MDAVLKVLAEHAGISAFLLLAACGLGLPPWSEEVVLLGTGYFVAADSISFLAGCLWCSAGLLAGDSLVWWMGKTLGHRVYRVPLLRRHMSPKRQARLRRLFLRHGKKAVFVARFVPGYRMAAYFMSGNLGMRYWKFLVLDLIGILITVPPSIFLGRLFAENLDAAGVLLRRFQIPLAVVAGGVLGLVLWRSLLRRRQRLETLRRQRAERGRCPSEMSR